MWEMFNNKKHYNVHVKTHQTEKVFECNICGNTFSTACNLYIYIYIYWNSKNVGFICGNKFRINSPIEHMRKVNSIKSNPISSFVVEK